jgi:hypothetical protein
MSQTTDLKGVQMAKTHGQSAINVGQLPIFVDGASAPLVTSKVTSKTLSKSLEMTRVQDTAFACDSFSGSIALATIMVDTSLKESMEVRRKILGLGREVKRMEIN